MTSTSDTVVTSRTREQWADNLRVVAIVGVIVVHTATGYLVDIPWYYEEERVTSGLWSTVLSFPVYAGGLFWLGPLFLVAGWFSVRSLAHRGPGGPGASDDLQLGHLTQEWLATSDDPQARTSGGYWHHQRRNRPAPAVHDQQFQDELLGALARFTATPLTRHQPKES